MCHSFATGGFFYFFLFIHFLFFLFFYFLNFDYLIPFYFGASSFAPSCFVWHSAPLCFRASLVFDKLPVRSNSSYGVVQSNL
ncbi:hypothetical protein I7I50_11791 [Histoplasma capsulatum G186AR]|uniref:Uncharacterized protein n=1 Tax=Ajellomyces capsulatus TaxID=5037 RepID=A0A8H7ZBD0_AJECA|nr:hypothetical protein I7I52_03029 [Histoplasma capsulatum]QSS70231.1 hypothetical protein I7I50_11791 [Histoplasma capsulatum G186AR]